MRLASASVDPTDPAPTTASFVPVLLSITGPCCQPRAVRVACSARRPAVVVPSGPGGRVTVEVLAGPHRHHAEHVTARVLEDRVGPVAFHDLGAPADGARAPGV